MPWTVLPVTGTVAALTAVQPEVGARIHLGQEMGWHGTLIWRWRHFMNQNDFKSIWNTHMGLATVILLNEVITNIACFSPVFIEIVLALQM